MINRLDSELGTYYLCSCGQKVVPIKRRIVNIWIAQRFYQSRGSVYTGQIRSLLAAITGGGVILLLIQAVWGVTPKLWILPLIWLFQMIGETLMGINDYHHWKIAQNETLFGFQYSPLAKEQLRRLKNIEQVVNPEQYKAESVVDIVCGDNGSSPFPLTSERANLPGQEGKRL